MNILVIAAHPDDEVLGCGATIAKKTREGHKVYVLIMTDGCVSQYPGRPEMIMRKQEAAITASKILGHKVIFENFADMHLENTLHVSINKIIEKHIEAIKPQVVFTHFPDYNSDHVACYRSSMVACRPKSGVRKLLLYAVDYHPDFKPNVFADTGLHFKDKKKAFKCYGMEIGGIFGQRSILGLMVREYYWGNIANMRSSEAFQLVRGTW